MTLLAAAQTVADTMTGNEPLGHGLQRWLDYDCTGSDVCHSLLYLF